MDDKELKARLTRNKALTISSSNPLSKDKNLNKAIKESKRSLGAIPSNFSLKR